MNNLLGNQKKARKARINLQEAEDSLYSSQNHLKAKEEQLLHAKRLGKTGENAVARLMVEIRRLKTEISRAEGLFESAKTNLFEILDSFHLLNQPQKLVEELDDHLPFLLFPVRVETRFMTVEEGKELWVRIFPDDIAVHTHEKALTKDELNAGMTYWREMWAASREENVDNKTELEKGAWRALAEGYGSYRAAWIASETKPETLEVDEVEDLQFPEFDEEILKQDSWSRAPRSKVMPDRFVVMSFSGGKKIHEKIGNLIPDPLYLGPEPQRYETEFVQAEGELSMGENLEWLTNFDKAVEIGMGVRLPLEGVHVEKGFDRLLVLGLWLSSDAQETQQLLEELVDNHHYSPDGMSLVPQGTPTNNTDRRGSGFSSTDAGEETSFLVETGSPNFEITDIHSDKADTQLFVEALGIEHGPLEYIQHAGIRDIKEAQAFNKAMWSATLGYFMDEMLNLSPATVGHTREFFTDFVTGRGPIPAIRVGSQPYGILPTTVFSRWQWSRELEGPGFNFLSQLSNVIQRIDQQWDNLVSRVPHVGSPGDSFQNLLNMLGLHASSVEFYRRQAVGKEYLWNYQQFSSSNKSARRFQDILNKIAKGILAELGYDFEEQSLIFNIAFFFDHIRIEDPFIDDVENAEIEKWSESARLKAKYKPTAEEPDKLQNFIEWLINSEYNALKIQRFENDSDEQLPIPKPLLYRLLHRSLLLTSYNTTKDIYVNHELTQHDTFKEMELPNVRSERDVTRWEFMDVKVKDVFPDLSNSDLPLAQFILTDEGLTLPEVLTLSNVRECLKRIADLPTARLERLLAEHIDLCTSRLDAWQMGMLNKRLFSMRYPAESEGQFDNRVKGIYLGAFGWLENLRPGPTAVQVDLEEVPESLREPEKGPIIEQPDNGGFIHGPSINHAVAAAVLRNAYLTHATPDKSSIMSVNLSSERVRIALSFLEGVRNGQDLGAMLGYQFERGLQDRHGDPSLAQYIPNFRQQYPLVADKITPDEEGEQIETKEARNVFDGYALVETVFLKKEEERLSYPYNVNGLPSPVSAAGKAIVAEVKRMHSTLDAIADLALAEGMYQVSQGNYDRAGAMLKAVTEGGRPPEPEIVNTPRSGAAINQKITIHFETKGSIVSPWGGTLTQRAIVEPGLNKWLGNILGDPGKIKYIVRYTVSDTATEDTYYTYSLSELELQPIDFIYLIGDDLASETTELESRIDYAFRKRKKSEDSAWDHTGDVIILFMERDGFSSHDKSLFEILPLLRNLRDIITGCRPLAADDYVLPSEETSDPEVDDNPKRFQLTVFETRLNNALSAFQNAIDELGALIPAEALDDDPDTEPDIDLIDFNNLREKLIALANFGVPDAFPEDALNTTDEVKKILLEQAVITKNLVDNKLAAANKLKDFNGLDPSELTVAEKIEFLKNAAKQIFGDSFNMIPTFEFKNEPELTAAVDFRNAAPGNNLTRFSNNPLIIEEWLQGAARVREKVELMESVCTFNDAFNESELKLKPLQLPYRENEHWVAVEFPEVKPEDRDKPDIFKPEGDFLSVVQQIPDGYVPSGIQSGLVIDEWSEVIPNKVETTGIAINYNQPNTEPPQTLLLAISPEITGSWKWDDLVAILHDTLDRAKKRAVEPEFLGATPYSQLLPAIISSVTTYPFATISTDLVYQTQMAALNNFDNDEGN